MIFEAYVQFEDKLIRDQTVKLLINNNSKKMMMKKVKNT